MTATAPPGVSALLCTHNGGPRIAQALESVLAQDYEGTIEVLVVDDGSTDTTADVVRSYADAVRLVELPENGGVSAARRIAVDMADNDLIAFIDDDDRWLPSRIAEGVRALAATPEAALVHGPVIDVYPDGTSRLRPMHPRADSYTELLTKDRIATSTVLLRREAYVAVGGFRPGLRSFGDWDLWTRLAARFPIVHVDRPVAEATMRRGSIQRGNPQAFEAGRRAAVELRRSELAAHGLVRRALAHHHYAVASKYAEAGDRRRAASHLAASCVRRPSPHAAALAATILLPSGASGRLRAALRQRRRLA